jgi:hypothetical protein
MAVGLHPIDICLQLLASLVLNPEDIFEVGMGNTSAWSSFLNVQGKPGVRTLYKTQAGQEIINIGRG